MESKVQDVRDCFVLPTSVASCVPQHLEHCDILKIYAEESNVIIIILEIQLKLLTVLEFYFCWGIFNQDLKIFFL